MAVLPQSFIAATGAVAEQNVVSSARSLVEEGVKLDYRFHMADRQAELCGNLANSLAGDVQELLLNSKQQAAALAQVTEAMKSLAAGSTQMAAGTAQTKIGVEKLNSVALDLKAMV